MLLPLSVPQFIHLSIICQISVRDITTVASPLLNTLRSTNEVCYMSANQYPLSRFSQGTRSNKLETIPAELMITNGQDLLEVAGFSLWLQISYPCTDHT